MKKLQLLVSTRVTLVLFLAFAGAMAVATFIENDHGTAVARSLVYEAWWFEIIMGWMAINFIAHIGHYRLFRREKWPIGLFHIAFVIIVLGAGVTRYFSEEGVLHIREGRAQDTFFSNENFVQLHRKEDPSVSPFKKQVSLIPKGFKPREINANIGNQPFKITIEEYISGAKQVFEDGEETYLDIAVALQGGREDYLVDMGKYLELDNFTLATKNDPEHAVRIFKENGDWVIYTDTPMQIMEMETQKMGNLPSGEKKALKLRTLYQWDGGAFMVKSIHENAKVSFVAERNEKMAEDLPDAVKLSVINPENGEILNVSYSKLTRLGTDWTQFEHEGNLYVVAYGAKAKNLPFSLYLNAFELERYPGSQSPSSYASEVMVMDGKDEFPYRIFMNNVLDHKGYRFYQSSFDNDERGTILSVNRDRAGTMITYLGYSLLTLGMFLTLFTKGSRFHLLNYKLGLKKKTEDTGQRVPKKYAVATYGFAGLLLFLLFVGSSQKPPSDTPAMVPLDQAEAYGKLVVQDLDGRMKPLNTLANEITRKLNGKNYVSIADLNGSTYRLSPEQFLLSVQLNPQRFSSLPILKIDKQKGQIIMGELGLPIAEELRFTDLVDEEGNYLIQHLVEEANRLKPSERNESHNEILKVDERFNIFYGVLTGDFLKLFPNKLDPNNTWFTSQQHRQGFEEDDAVFVKNITNLYLGALQKGIEDGDFSEAEETLSYISLYQEKAGKEVYPSKGQLQTELLYNKLNLGSKLFGYFWLLGVLLLVVVILMLFYGHPTLTILWKSGKAFAWIGFLVFTIHLGLRWYIANHPPWSDGFEMLVFVAWGVLLFGLLFAKKSRFTIPLGLLFAGTLLFVGFLDWLNPEITNLMPVLNSYWLKIHVAIIVSGYAPLALAAIIALLSLFLLIFKPKVASNKWWQSLRELRIVNELSITIGLFLLTVGTFLGGVWANESWGRYWAWDPKETWALISIIVYAFVLHMRLVPGLKSGLIYSLSSLWAFSAIIMTSFGVNYYLSGLHSYAKGDPVPIPGWVFWVVAGLLLVSVFSYSRFRELTEQEKRKLLV
ncbi:cytochrome c biogenesis protein [Pleomorphovibrio marinus]|uniref:cytochrome c biogenesis protein n=1 Tax=Pleomorphovibrio marinus TaxID=2164132 RepID=UPI000E0B9661|nr:cytochrome c biogenesis protein CcsA [Pleomorphovibrio marinus]